jgi:hypothetical protein
MIGRSLQIGLSGLPNPRGYKGRILVGCNRDAEHSQQPQQLLTWVGDTDSRELDTPTIPASLRGDGLPDQGSVIGRLGRTRSQSRSCRRAVRQRGRIERCMRSAVPSLAEQWGGTNYRSLRRCSKNPLASRRGGWSGLVIPGSHNAACCSRRAGRGCVARSGQV